MSISSQISLWVASASTGAIACVACSAWQSITPLKRPVTGEPGIKRSIALKNRWFRSLEPTIGKLAHLSSRGISEKFRNLAEQKLVFAGHPAGLSADELIAVGFLLALAGAITGVLLSSCAERPPWGISLSSAILAALWPWLKLDGMGRARRTRALRELPQVLDLLVLAMKTGMDFNNALRTTTSQLRKNNPWKFEFQLLLASLELGHRHIDALEQTAKRIDQPVVRQLVSAVSRAQLLGTPLVRTLERQTEIVRMRHSQAVEQRAARAGVLILGPLMLIFACLMIILLGPFMVRYLRGELF